MLYLIVTVLFVIALSPLYSIYKGKVIGQKRKSMLLYNLSGMAIVMLSAIVLPLTSLAAGTTDAAAVTTAASDGLKYIAAALSVGIACIGSGIAVAAGASAAIGATSEDPKVFGKAIVFVGLGEGIAIFGFVIAVMILSK